MAESRPSLLVVDDDAVYRERLAQAIAARGYDVRTAADAEAAIRLAEADSPEFAVLDLRMPGESGLDLLRRLRGIDPATRVLMLTGYGSIATAMEAVRLGAVNYLTKPADVDDILAAFNPEGPGPDANADQETPSLARVEWEHIQRVLNDCEGNLSEAARRLGMHRRSLQRKAGRKRPPK
ncbi:MAG: response regulator [Geothrix sp.]|uniref:response regulator transcription factor n=1 Tax=Geothrix sp. TaxID=1962974 RepID=UPI00181E8459|nr:response regulator [Geothrix sp.]NWJ40986.1 response regulator [Geothrix sp.]WIL21017.1 MAG: response regulator [Geothrix sp.]